MSVMPYLMFNGRAEEAAEFYGQALNAEIVELMRFSEAPEGACSDTLFSADWMNKVMHMHLRIAGSDVLCSDGVPSEPAAFQGVSLAVSASDSQEVTRYYDALRDGGEVTMPLEETFFATRFGMVTDRFGVSWMVIQEN